MVAVHRVWLSVIDLAALHTDRAQLSRLANDGDPLGTGPVFRRKREKLSLLSPSEGDIPVPSNTPISVENSHEVGETVDIRLTWATGAIAGERMELSQAERALNSCQQFCHAK